jgi:DNA-directed RNA polymerase specialized sigma24 family protein
VHLTDGEVMASAVEQPDLFVTIFDGHGKAVHAFLSRRAGRQTADDVQREVWLQAFRSRHRFDASWSNARPWLYGIARNALRSHGRSASRHQHLAPSTLVVPWSEVDRKLDAARTYSSLKPLPRRLSRALLDVCES